MLVPIRLLAKGHLPMRPRHLAFDHRPEAPELYHRQPQLQRDSYGAVAFSLPAVESNRGFRERMPLPTFAGFVGLDTGVGEQLDGIRDAAIKSED